MSASSSSPVAAATSAASAAAAANNRERTKWTEAEDEALRNAVNRFGAK
jgi:hypothetical protein